MKALPTKAFKGFLFSILSLSAILCADAPSKSVTPVPPNTIRIVVEKDDNNNFHVFNLDSSGQKEPLTLGSFFRASAEVMLGKKITECAKGEPLKLFYEQNQNSGMTYLVDAQGQKKRFLLKDLIVALPGTIKCGENKAAAKPTTDTKTTEQFVQVFFDKDNAGKLQTYIVHPDGRKEPLEFANLLTANAELLKDCQLGTEKNRAIYIAFEKDAQVNPQTRSTDKYPPDVLQAVQINAYGVKEELNLDNLVNAAAQSLQVCAKEKGKPLATPPTTPALQVKFDKDASNHLKAYLIDSKGNRKDLSLETLISAASGISPCPLAPKTHFIDVTIEKDSSGNFKPYVIDANGNKKDFNLLGNLMTTALTLCANQQAK